MRAKNLEIKRKTSLYLDDSLKKEIAIFFPNMNQSEFMHNAANALLEHAKKEKAKNEFLKILHGIKPVKRKTTARQTLEKLRKEREKQLLKNLKN